jgi:hypothetical protein
MLIYNVTVNVDETIHESWLQWIRNKHIKEVLATGKFHHAKLVKVLVQEEMGGHTYAVQYHTKSKALLEAYYEEDAPRLREEGLGLFGDKMLAFRTELQIIEEF